MFPSRPSRPDPEVTARIKAWATEILSLGNDDVVSVAQLACHDPGCPPVEILVTILSPNAPRRELRVHKAAADIERGDLLTAI